MPETFKILQTIERVKAPEALYDKIAERIWAQKKISWSRVTAAAAVLACIFSVELYMVTAMSSSEEMAQLEEIVELPDNILYNE